MTSAANDAVLPSWRSGPSRDAVVTFLDQVPGIDPADRLACFDVDGTLWCERPTYVQFDFLLDALTHRVADAPDLADRPEFAAVLSGDDAAIGELGLERIALALTGLFEGVPAPEFAAVARDFLARGANATLGRPLRAAVYRPMLELLDALRAHDFTISLVTGGGTEFVRALAPSLLGVAPEHVIGTLITYRLDRDEADRPRLLRTNQLAGGANEGEAKVFNIQAQLGRSPVVAGGNSGGDREMLEWAANHDGPTLSVLVNHDDADREFEYVSTAQTFTEAEPITEVGARLGWTVVSMAQDWSRIFPDVDGDTP